MKELFLLKLGEIVLKGQNRRVFEDKLKTVTRRRMVKFGEFKVSIVQSTLYVEPLTDDCDLDGAWEACGTIFGVAQMCRCRACEKNLDAMFAAVCDYLGEELSMAKSFKVESKRSDKRFPLNSIQISQEIGGRLAEEFPNVLVDVHNPDYTVNIEVRETAAYVHGPSVPGAGGLPTGTGGRAAVLLSGGIDSPVAGYMIAKRGVEIECIHFFSYPYTSELAKEKVLELAHIMTKFCGRMTVDIVGFTEIQEAIRDHCREEYFTIIMRRFMMRIAEAIGRDHGAKCLVTGENLGQVASQTMDAMAVTGAVVHMPIFHPLIGMDKEEIVTVARRIGTLDTSILPYEDCCTVFTPKHPKTKPVLAQVEAEEQKLDVEGLIARAIANTEKTQIRYYEGGLIGKLLTDVPGASAVYKGGVISYVNEIKHRLLGVEQEILDVCTAVSRETAHEMARGARERLAADCAVSVTGLAGPDGDGTGRPVGLVYIAVDTAGFSFCKELHLSGDRAKIREQAADAVFQLILDTI